MNVKEKAKEFAIMAHKGQLRKSEKEKPMIIHPIEVGMLLESWEFDDNVVAAGYLHDVVEDTKYTNFLIEKYFGSDIANLVYTASEPDKKLSWEERKTHTIESCRNLPLRNKAVICADKISNLESMDNLFKRKGKRDFSAFKRGEDSQRWYYTEIYKSLINGEDKELEMFRRLKNALDNVFYPKVDNTLKYMIFEHDNEYLRRLQEIDAKKKELLKLKAFCTELKPFVIEFTGTPRTGKTTMINNLYDFFKKGGFDTHVIEEFTTSKYFKEDFSKKIAMFNPEDRDILIIEEVTRIIENEISLNPDIILIDRGINDRQIWNNRRMVRGELPVDRYLVEKRKYEAKSKELVDALVVTYADYLTSLRRDYQNSLALEQRRFLNQENIEEYNRCLDNVSDSFKRSVDELIMIDTTSISPRESSLLVASKVLPMMRKRYLRNINKAYN